MLAELLLSSKDATRVLLRAEMDRLVDPMLDSIFNRLQTKLTNGFERTQSDGGTGGDCAQAGNRNRNLHYKPFNVPLHQPSTFIPQLSTSSHSNQQFVNMNYSYHQQNYPNHLDHSIFNKKLSSQPQCITIKEEFEPIPTGQVQPSLYAPVNEQSNHNLTDQHNDENENFQINLSHTEMLPQPQRFSHIKHNQFDEEECDCDECVDGGFEVKEEDKEKDQINKESSRTVKRPKIDSTQQNNAQTEVASLLTKQSNDETQSNGDRPNKEDNRMANEQSEDIATRVITEDCSQDNSDQSMNHELTMMVQQEERDTNNAIGGEIATERTTKQIQPNLPQPNRHFQCHLCPKSFYHRSKMQRHVRVHTDERPFACDQCDKRYNDRGHLTRHKLIHQNIKRFRCHECDKQFTLKYVLDYHLLTHSGVRPFECRHCEKSFTKSDTRNRHEQAIHLHVRSYRCKQCGQTGTKKSDVIKHIRMVHFGLPQTIKQQQALNIIDDRDPKELLEEV